MFQKPYVFFQERLLKNVQPALFHTMKADSDGGTPNNVSSIVSCYQTWRTFLIKFLLLCFHRRKIVIRVWNDTRVSKWWLDFFSFGWTLLLVAILFPTFFSLECVRASSRLIADQKVSKSLFRNPSGFEVQSNIQSLSCHGELNWPLEIVRIRMRGGQLSLQEKEISFTPHLEQW